MLIIKVGGGKTINWNYVCKDIASLIKKEAIVLVHGAASKRDEVAEKLGNPTRYLLAPSGNQGVHTDKRALDILTMVYAGLVNKKIVAKFQKLGVNAVGLSGADGRIWLGKRKKYLLSVENGKTKLVKDTFTGKIEKVNTQLLKQLIKSGYLPIITQPAVTYEGELINTDNDRNVAVMAKALKVKTVVVLFEAPGLLKNPEEENSLIKQIKKDEIDDYLKFAKGRMRKKVLGAKETIKAGVEEIFWGDGRIKNPIRKALRGEGTVIK